MEENRRHIMGGMRGFDVQSLKGTSENDSWNFYVRDAVTICVDGDLLFLRDCGAER
jgi:hypothetical protein